MPNYVSKMTVGGSTALIKDSEARDLIKENTDNINTLNDHAKDKSNPHNVTAEQLGVAKSNIVDMIYPVGSIYMSVNDVDPATLFGGTWTKIVGKFLLGADEENGYTLGSTGGEASHTITVDEMPAHAHGNSTAGLADTTGYSTLTANALTVTANTKIIGLTTTSVGGGQPMSLMPPYLVVNVWQRTA